MVGLFWNSGVGIIIALLLENGSWKSLKATTNFYKN